MLLATIGQKGGGGAEDGGRLLSNAGTYLANNVAPHVRNQ